MIYFLTNIIIIILVELLYFKVAIKFEIIDKPNSRSSHSSSVIRGGGVVFIAGIWFWFFSSSFLWPYFFIGATLIACVSFLDDIKPQPALIRFFVHLVAVLLLFYQVDLFAWSWWLLMLAGIICIGALNAYNFMDGINGITGVNALVYLGTCIYLNFYYSEFTDVRLLLSLAIAVGVFLFFNFRKTARCFAGDVGSMTLAFVQIFFLLQLIQKTNSLLWVGMFFVFGIDSVITIAYRIKRRENIFKAHRTHLYQYLSNELAWDHRTVSILYGLTQLGINICLIAFLEQGHEISIFLMGGVIVIGYLTVRNMVTSRIGFKI